MNRNLSTYIKLISILTATFLAMALAGCGTTGNGTGGDELGSFRVEKSGAILWGEHCSRCHNAPDPSAFSDVQWEAIGTHMRIRAGLTADDTRKIIEFLQQSN